MVDSSVRLNEKLWLVSDEEEREREFYMQQSVEERKKIKEEPKENGTNGKHFFNLLVILNLNLSVVYFGYAYQPWLGIPITIVYSLSEKLYLFDGYALYKQLVLFISFTLPQNLRQTLSNQIRITLFPWNSHLYHV